MRVYNFMTRDGFSSRILETELATLYEARLQGHEPPLPTPAPLQYADYAVWQRQITQPDSPYLHEVMNWWKTLLSVAPPATRLPFKQLAYRTDLDPGEGMLRWMLEERVAKRLDEIARDARTTQFIVRLAVFAALMADLTGNSTVIFGTFFDNRNRTTTQTIVGRLLNSVPLVLCYDASKTFRQWLEIVHDRVFETLAHCELPFEKIHEQLREAGIEPPSLEIFFMQSRDHTDQHFGNLVISQESWRGETMPWCCTFYVDGKKPENCQVRFDARFYGRSEMRALLDRYLRLLEIASREPELRIGKLVTMMGAKPLRLTWAIYATAFNQFLKPYFDASPVLKTIVRPIKRWVSSGR